MKKSLLGIVFVFILVGCGKYVEPASSSNISLLVLKEKKDGQRFTYTFVKIDGNVLDRSHFSTTRLRVQPGEHEIKYEPTIYYSERAKHAEPETFILEFKANNVYTVELIPHVTKLKKYDDDVTGTFKVFENKKLIIKKDLVFEDSLMRSGPVQGSVDPMVVDSIIYSAVLSSGI
ncbi:hypothetical protein MN086_07795 [Sulfurovum sp. XGS-02]|uniref:hypothetical protein n=1 Tax=Sulfurovum sp. XGS-02 TaxID=2925411 RepID=UPI002066611A|nr:hypothetical protein [Sulfurovum sp. XGS-02]UPT76956.1 hypothetical protein MN086_07795 [Sulfurovum sp. XGS-02]